MNDEKAASNSQCGSGRAALFGRSVVRLNKRNSGDLSVQETVQLFCRDVQTGDHSCLEPTLRAMDRLGCWAAALEQFAVGPSPDVDKGNALLSFWFTYGLWSIPRGLRGDLPCLIDVFRHLLPPYTGGGLILYRGELVSRHRRRIYGISWTPNIETARRFAARRSSLHEGTGVVLRIEASTKMIAAAVRDHSNHTLTLDEDEYLVDPRQLAGKVDVVI